MDGIEHTIWLNVEHGIFATVDHSQVNYSSLQTFNCGRKEAAQIYPATQPALFPGNIVAWIN